MTRVSGGLATPMLTNLYTYDIGNAISMQRL
jgi:hypothetical protein